MAEVKKNHFTKKKIAGYSIYAFLLFSVTFVLPMLTNGFWMGLLIGLVTIGISFSLIALVILAAKLTMDD